MSRRQRPTVSALLRLLRAGDEEQLAATAVVIGALDPPDSRVVPALARALEAAPAHLKPYLVDALGRLSDDRALAHVAPLLLSEGVLREQAVRIFEQHPGRVTPLLEKVARGRGVGSLQPLAWVAVCRADEEARAFLLSLLERSDFEGARMLYMALRSRVSAWPAAARRDLATALTSMIDGLGTGGDDHTLEIACLKIMTALADSRVLTTVLARTAADRPHVVRMNALEALAELPLPARRRPAIARRLMPFLEAGRSGRLEAAVLRVLLRLDPPVLGAERLMRFAASDDPEFARTALSGLGRFPRRDVARLLLESLLHAHEDVRAAAAASLGGLTPATDLLLEAHEDPRFQPVRDRILEILAFHGNRLDARRFARLARSQLDGARDAETLQARILLLARIQRPATNRMVENRARRALQSCGTADAVTLLEPLVRGRLATPRGRTLLALAHLAAAPPALPPEERSVVRALQLLGPLARLPDWKLHLHLAREQVLGDERRGRLLDVLASRSEAERDVAAHLRRRWTAPGA